MNVDVLTVSSKGQIVLPVAILGALSIVEGTKLAAYAIGNTIMLKPIRVPTDDDFLAFLDEAQGWAAESGLTEADIGPTIADVRREGRRRES